MHQLSLIKFVTLSLAVAFAMPKANVFVESHDLIKKGSLLYYQGRPFSGIAVERWINGKPFQQNQYRKGLADGSSLKYALNGNLIERLHFHAGKKDGLQEGWFEEGPKKYQFRFKNGILDGPQTEWHMNGKVFRQQVFVAGREVSRKIFYPNGAIFTNYAKRDNRIYGQDGGALCREPAKQEGVK